MNRKGIRKNLNKSTTILIKWNATKRLLITLIILFLFSVSFSANNITVLNSYVVGADTGQLYIVMQNDSTVVDGLNFIIQFDPNLLIPLNISPVGQAALLSGSGANIFNGNKMSFIVFDYNSNYIGPSNGQIFKVQFIRDSSVTVDTSTQLVFLEGMVADTSNNEVSFQYTNGSIGLYPFCSAKPGDATNDGKTNLADIVFDVNFIFKGGPSPTPKCRGNANADTNPDGSPKINLTDIIYLVNFIFKGGPAPIKSAQCCL